MAERAAGSGHMIARALVGLGYVVTGLLLIVTEVRDITIRWSIVTPTVIVVLGLALLVTGLVDGHLRASTSEHR